MEQYYYWLCDNIWKCDCSDDRASRVSSYYLNVEPLRQTMLYTTNRDYEDIIDDDDEDCIKEFTTCIQHLDDSNLDKIIQNKICDGIGYLETHAFAKRLMIVFDKQKYTQEFLPPFTCSFETILGINDNQKADTREDIFDDYSSYDYIYEINDEFNHEKCQWTGFVDLEEAKKCMLFLLRRDLDYFLHPQEDDLYSRANIKQWYYCLDWLEREDLDEYLDIAALSYGHTAVTFRKYKVIHTFNKDTYHSENQYNDKKYEYW